MIDIMICAQYYDDCDCKCEIADSFNYAQTQDEYDEYVIDWDDPPKDCSYRLEHLLSCQESKQ